MKLRTVARLLALSWVALLAPGAPAAAGVWDAWLHRIRASGAARVEVVELLPRAEDGGSDSLRLRLTLQPPGFLRIEHADRSQAVVIRPDGGELLDHRMKQWVRLRADQARRAAGVWRLLLDPASRLGGARVGPRRYLVRLPAEEGWMADSLWVTVTSDSLPRRLDLSGETEMTLELKRWRFLRPLRRDHFRLACPSGYAAVDWP